MCLNGWLLPGWYGWYCHKCETYVPDPATEEVAAELIGLQDEEQATNAELSAKMQGITAEIDRGRKLTIASSERAYPDLAGKVTTGGNRGGGKGR